MCNFVVNKAYQTVFFQNISKDGRSQDFGCQKVQHYNKNKVRQFQQLYCRPSLHQHTPRQLEVVLLYHCRFAMDLTATLDDCDILSRFLLGST